MKRPGRPGSSDRGPSRGGLGGSGRRKPEPESDSDQRDESDEESDGAESSEEEVPAKKKGSARTSARGGAKTDSARKKRTSASMDRGGGGGPPQEENLALKKAMLIATPILLVFVIIMAVVVANKPGDPEKPKDIVVNLDDDIVKARKLRTEAVDLLKQAGEMSDNESKKGPLLTAEKKLRDAQALIDNVRDKTPPPKEGMEDPFEHDYSQINETLKMVRTAIMESGAR